MKVSIDENVLREYMQSVETLKKLRELDKISIAKLESTVQQLQEENAKLLTANQALQTESSANLSLLKEAHSAMVKVESKIDLGLHKSKQYEHEMSTFSVHA